MKSKYIDLIKLWTEAYANEKTVPSSVIKKLVSEIIFRETGISVNEQIIDLFFEIYAFTISVLLNRYNRKKISLLDLGYLNLTPRECNGRLYRKVNFCQSELLRRRFKAWQQNEPNEGGQNENMPEENWGGERLPSEKDKES